MRKFVFIFSLAFFACSCNILGNTPEDSVTSKISVLDAIQERSNLATTIRFTINVSPTNPKTITVNYKTVDSTAIAGKDYTALSGT